MRLNCLQMTITSSFINYHSREYRFETSPGSQESETMQRKELHLDSFLPNLIRSLSEGMMGSMSRRINGPFRLTVTEWRILLQLAEHRALTASDIVKYSGMEKSKVSRAIANLEERGLVVRKVASDDHRVKRLSMTDTGLKRYRALVPRILDWEKEMIDGLEVSEYRDLLYLLDKLNRQLKSMHEEEPSGQARMND